MMYDLEPVNLSTQLPRGLDFFFIIKIPASKKFHGTLEDFLEFLGTLKHGETSWEYRSHRRHLLIQGFLVVEKRPY